VKTNPWPLKQSQALGETCQIHNHYSHSRENV